MLESIAKTIEKYTYGKNTSKEFIDQLRFKMSEEELIISNWDDYSNNSLIGDCDELTIKTYQAIKEKHPEAHIQAAWGYEPRFFTHKTGMHAFLLIQHDNKSYVVDPSFKEISPLEESKYEIYSIQEEQEITEKIAKGSLDMRLNKERGRTAIGVHTEKNEIYYLGFNTDTTRTTEEFLDFKIHAIKEETIIKTRFIKPADIPNKTYATFLGNLNEAIKKQL